MVVSRKMTETRCPECKSTNIQKAGFAITRRGKKQRFQCRECGRVFYGDDTEVKQ